MYICMAIYICAHSHTSCCLLLLVYEESKSLEILHCIYSLPVPLFLSIISLPVHQVPVFCPNPSTMYTLVLSLVLSPYCHSTTNTHNTHIYTLFYCPSILYLYLYTPAPCTLYYVPFPNSETINHERGSYWWCCCCCCCYCYCCLTRNRTRNRSQ